ncbi:MAG: hypothetical protein WA708_06855 [Acidobacteriaceae bacterium]
MALHRGQATVELTEKLSPFGANVQRVQREKCGASEEQDAVFQQNCLGRAAEIDDAACLINNE